MNQLRYLGATLLCFLSVLSVSVAIASTDAEEVSRQWLEHQFHSQDASTLHQRIEEAHEELRRRTAQEPTEESKARLVFSPPQLQAKLVELARRYSLEVTAVRHVTITRTRTFRGQFMKLNSFTGSLNKKLTCLTKRLVTSMDRQEGLLLPQTPMQDKALQASIVEAVEASAERKQRILEEGLKFYVMQVVGALADLSHLQQVESSVAAVQLRKSHANPRLLLYELFEKLASLLPKSPLALMCGPHDGPGGLEDHPIVGEPVGPPARAFYLPGNRTSGEVTSQPSR